VKRTMIDKACLENVLGAISMALRGYIHSLYPPSSDYQELYGHSHRYLRA
jgi:hypothetical protein